MTLLNNLVNAYAATDLGTIFSSQPISIGSSLAMIDNELYEGLKEVTLAQWLLESARATSQLANTANNFAGLKWRNEMSPFATLLNIQVPSEPIPVDFCQFNDVNAFITGYWKFLTRSPYAGLADHTNSPDNFMGFLQRQGFAADIDYVNKVIKLIPESRNLLAQARGLGGATSPNKFQVVGFPKEVGVGQGFKIEGTAPLSTIGQNLTILIDGNFKPPAPQVGDNGKWIINFVFNKPGTRKMMISLGAESASININVSPVAGSGDPENTTPVGSVKLILTGSVGSGGVNKSAEVMLVKKRLHSLGYTWVGDLNSGSQTTGFIQAIKLFQSVVLGQSTVDNVDGRIDVGGPTHSWLQAKNAPVWKLMPNSDPSINFVNFERAQTNDDHDYGTSWLYDAILAIARDYHTKSPSTAPFTINDVSIPHGGDTPDHHGHETGLMCDVNLPRTDGKSGNITWNSDIFDRNATRILIKAMRNYSLVRLVYFNDEELMNDGLCDFALGHDNHIHFEINPPVIK
jgi:Mannosyl-glycoprotein endo-beta-N-acetylglucosaminidase